MEKRAYDSDEGLCDGPDLAPVRKKMAPISQEVEYEQGQDPLRISPPVEDSLSSPGTHSNVGNYMASTKSNNDDEDVRQRGEEQMEMKRVDEQAMGTKDEEEEEEQTTSRNEESYEQGEREEKTSKKEAKNEPGDEDRNEAPTAAPPRWTDFFTSPTPADTQNSQSPFRCSHTGPSPCGMTGGPRTPELFSEDDEEEAELTSSQSTNLSNQVLSDQEDTPLTDTLIIYPDHQWEEIGVRRVQSVPVELSGSNKALSDEDTSMTDTHIIQSEERMPERGEIIAGVHGGEEIRGQIVQLEPGPELSASQASSDFDIPCTPDSHSPSSQELAQLYKKLASGEELVTGKGSHGKDA